MEKYLKFAKLILKTLGKPIGILVLVLCVTCLVSWQSDKISKFLGVPEFVAWIERWPIPQADPTRFSVMVAHLQNDTTRGQEQLIVEALKGVRRSSGPFARPNHSLGGAGLRRDAKAGARKRSPISEEERSLRAHLGDGTRAG